MSENSYFKIPSKYIARVFSDDDILPDYRSEFMRDRDRVMYCTAFRRLAGKTQIYTIGSDDHKRNRLTHTLEVAQIARTVAKALDLDCDLAEAIALGHDLGHTPFGHAGERILHEIMTPESNKKLVKESPFSKKAEEIRNTLAREAIQATCPINIDNMFGFKHNLQSVRVATQIEDSYRDTDGRNIGLNLTNYTLWGIQNHSKQKYTPDSAYPNYQNQHSECLAIKGLDSEGCGTEMIEAWSLEGYIVEIADDIAQWHHDLEDALRGDAMPLRQICETIAASLRRRLSANDLECLQSYQNKEGMRTNRKCIAELSHIVINTLVNDVVETSRNNLKTIRDNLSVIDAVKVPEAFYSAFKSLNLKISNKQIKRSEIISFSQVVDTTAFKDVIQRSVHHSLNVERMNIKGSYIIRKLFEAYYKHPQQLPDGPILHLMVEFGEYENIDKAKEAGTGMVRTKFDDELENPTMIKKCLLMRKICDHIAAMTDRYAIEEYNNLYG